MPDLLGTILVGPVLGLCALVVCAGLRVVDSMFVEFFRDVPP